MNPMRLMHWAEGVNRMGRPFLTVLVTTLYNGALLVALGMGALNIRDYIMAMGPSNSMIIGFWFGERSAVRAAEAAAEKGKSA